MKLFRYKPGSTYQIRISEETYCRSKKRIAADLANIPEQILSDVQVLRQEWRSLAGKLELDQYNSSGFGATELFSIFMDAMTQQMQVIGAPEVIAYQQRHKMPPDILKQVQEAYEGFLVKERRLLARKVGDETVIFSIVGSVGRAFHELYTGKSEEMRDFEQQIVSYVAGDSDTARRDLMNLVKKYGVKHDGVHETIMVIRNEMLFAELAYKGFNQKR